MSEGQELKLTEEAFNTAIEKLDEYNKELTETKDSINSVNEELKKDWLGDSGTAFSLSANVLEANFTERIKDLEEEIKALEDAKESLFNEDSYLAGAIAGGITGMGSAAAEIAASGISQSNK